MQLITESESLHAAASGTQTAPTEQRYLPIHINTACNFVTGSIRPGSRVRWHKYMSRYGSYISLYLCFSSMDDPSNLGWKKPTLQSCSTTSRPLLAVVMGQSFACKCSEPVCVTRDQTVCVSGCKHLRLTAASAGQKQTQQPLNCSPGLAALL